MRREPEKILEDKRESVLATIASALISATGAVIVCTIQHNKTVALINYRMDALEKKQDKYNNVIERTYHLEQETAVCKEKISVANKRIADLEKGQNQGKQ